jgi:hypothetical protein
MATCEICGTDFDDLGVQIVLPGLAKSFDSIDCAVRARNLAGASGAGFPMRGMLVPLAAGSATRPFALAGLSAGLAAALAGTRARVALGGATVGVALLVATTAHLATRDGQTGDATTRPQALAPPARSAADSADRVRVSALTQTTTPRSAPEVRYTLLAASRSTDVPRAARVRTMATRTRTHAPKAVRHARQTRSTQTTSSSSVRTSARSGWGHGDKNHNHSGPRKQHNQKSHKKK